MSFTGPGRRRRMLWPEDLREIQETGRTRDGGRIRHWRGHRAGWATSIRAHYRQTARNAASEHGAPDAGLEAGVESPGQRPRVG